MSDRFLDKSLPVIIVCLSKACIAGFYPPTSGTIYLNGVDICKDTERARRGLGLCPQHNVLYDELTVDEHLVFIAKVTLRRHRPRPDGCD